MMPYNPKYWRHTPGANPPPGCTGPHPWIQPSDCPSHGGYQHYWERCPGQPYRPPINHGTHADKYFYTILFLDDYFDQPIPPNPNRGLTIYSNITETFQEDSPLQWDTDDPNKLIVKHKLHLPVTLEVWDKDNKPIIYAPILKQMTESITIGRCTVQDETTIIVDFTDLTKPTGEEMFLIGIKQLPDFYLDPLKDVPSEAIQTLQEFMAVPRVYCKGLAIVFRRNSLQGLFDLISDFDETYFHSMDKECEVSYLVKKSCYKDLHFTTKYTNLLQDVLDLIDVNYYKVQYSWQDHKRYKDGYNDYQEKYGYK